MGAVGQPFSTPAPTSQPQSYRTKASGLSPKVELRYESGGFWKVLSTQSKAWLWNQPSRKGWLSLFSGLGSLPFGFHPGYGLQLPHSEHALSPGSCCPVSCGEESKVWAHTVGLDIQDPLSGSQAPIPDPALPTWPVLLRGDAEVTTSDLQI